MAGLGLVEQDKKNVTVDELKKLFPDKKGAMTEETADLINAAVNDPEFQGADLIDTMVTYQNVMASHKGNMHTYLDAIKFCAYLETESDNFTEAYRRAFVRRDFVRERIDAEVGSNEYKQLTSAAARYRRTPMVIGILTQANVPLRLMFQASKYEAVGVLANEMKTAAFSKDRIAAADKLLVHLGDPEEQKIELEVGMNSEARSVQESLFAQMKELTKNQKQMMDSGADISQVQRLGIKSEVIDAELE